MTSFLKALFDLQWHWSQRNGFAATAPAPNQLGSVSQLSGCEWFRSVAFGSSTCHHLTRRFRCRTSSERAIKAARKLHPPLAAAMRNPGSSCAHIASDAAPSLSPRLPAWRADYKWPPNNVR